jgi:hypothetical protein
MRLWRAGRLSDRTTVVLLVGRLPIIVFHFGVRLGMPLVLLLGLTAITVLTPVLFYGTASQLLQDQRREIVREAATAR